MLADQWPPLFSPLKVCLSHYFFQLIILKFESGIDDEASVLKRFLHGMGYYTPNISGTNEKLEAAMRKEMHERKIQCPQLERTLSLAANLIEVLLRSRIPLLCIQQLNFLLFIAGIPRMYIRREETYCII